MEPAHSDRSSLSRRGFLAGVGGASVGLASVLSGPAHASAVQSSTVLTWNLSLGVGLSRLFRARSMDDVRQLTGELLDDARNHPYEARIEALAAEIAAADADVVAVQEAALVRTQRPGDFGESSDEAATTVLVDLLAGLVSALETEGAAYDVAASTVTTDIELPADGEDGQVDVRLTDRDAILVRRGVETGEARSGRYDARLDFPVPGTERWLSLERGYCLVDVHGSGGRFTAATTHLEATSDETRASQAAELLDVLPSDRPVVLAGDFNSGPGTTTRAYDALTESYTDAHAERRPDDDGFTCCQASGLKNDEPRLGKRVDAVLYRGGVRPTAVDRIGEDPDDRFELQRDGETVSMWPSDHAGVVATLEIPAVTPTTTGTPSPTATETPSPTATEPARETASPTSTATARTTSGSGSGFGVLSTAAALGLGALARRRWK